MTKKKKNEISRRDFLKMTSLASVSLPVATVLGKIGNDEIVFSPEEYSGFLIRRPAKGAPPYQVDDSVYKRFDQKNDVFSRNVWDEKVIADEQAIAGNPVEMMQKQTPGKSRVDFAFYTAAWTVATSLGSQSGAIGGVHAGLYDVAPLAGTMAAGYPFGMLGPWNPGAEGYSPEEVTTIIKKAAKLYGASLAGIATVDERWFYDKAYQGPYTNNPETIGRHAPIVFEEADAPKYLEDGTLVIPKSMKYVIAMAFEMDEDGIATSLAGPASAAVGNGYSRMSFTAGSLAEFIRALGYNALPCGNNTALSIPIAVDAGLGELGRNGMLITPKYGPRVRLAKVVTDLPLVPDAPISFGVTEFCENCGKCADNCPGGAILKGQNARTYEPVNLSTNPGVYKWPVDCVKCHQVWTQNGMDCSVCIRTCPFNKPDAWLHSATRALIAGNSGTLDQLMVKLDDASGYGTQLDTQEFWKRDRYVHVKS